MPGFLASGNYKAGKVPEHYLIQWPTTLYQKRNTYVIRYSRMRLRAMALYLFSLASRLRPVRGLYLALKLDATVVSGRGGNVIDVSR